jgi:hypothetical protein
MPKKIQPLMCDETLLQVTDCYNIPVKIFLISEKRVVSLKVKKFFYTPSLYFFRNAVL